MKEEYRISRNVRLAWFLGKLNQVIWPASKPELVSFWNSWPAHLSWMISLAVNDMCCGCVFWLSFFTLNQIPSFTAELREWIGFAQYLTERMAARFHSYHVLLHADAIHPSYLLGPKVPLHHWTGPQSFYRHCGKTSTLSLWYITGFLNTFDTNKLGNWLKCSSSSDENYINLFLFVNY